MEALVDSHDFDIPKSMIDQEIDVLKQQAMQQFGGQGANFPELPSELFEEKASRRVKLGLIVSEIIKQNKIAADQGLSEI